VLKPLLTAGGGQGFCVNLSVDTSSVDIMEFCREIGALLHRHRGRAVAWVSTSTKARSRSAFELCAARNRAGCAPQKARRPTAVSCCGANPGMVSWFVKQALLNVAGDLGPFNEPKTREGWGSSPKARRQGHPYRRARHPARQKPKPIERVRQYLVGRGLRVGRHAAGRARLGHAREMDADERQRKHKTGCQAAIYLTAARRQHARALMDADGQGAIRLPGHPQRVDLDRRLLHVRDGGRVVYRPTCHYAYHPPTTPCCRCTRCSAPPARRQPPWHILDEHEIVDGIDELGVLLYGHAKNAYWYGSQLSIEETRAVAPYQNATGLQVTSAVLAGMVWALENPNAGIVEADEMDFRRCLEVQRPISGR
jgi:homospermidine synthase